MEFSSLLSGNSTTSLMLNYQANGRRFMLRQEWNFRRVSLEEQPQKFAKNLRKFSFNFRPGEPLSSLSRWLAGGK